MSEEMSVDKLVSIFIKMRDARDEIKREADDKIKDIEAQMNTVNQKLLDLLGDQGADSIKTPHGTVYRTVKSRYWTNDWESLYDFIAESDAFDLLEKRIHQSNMKQFLEENPALMPKGINVDSEYQVVVRRSK
jgi:hypothetical protein